MFHASFAELSINEPLKAKSHSLITNLWVDKLCKDDKCLIHGISSVSDVHDRDILDRDLAIDTNYLPEERTRPPLKHASVDALSID